MINQWDIFDYLVKLFGDDKVFLVGGFVRDYLLHLESHDYDFALGLDPTQVKKILNHHDEMVTKCSFEQFGVFQVEWQGTLSTLACMRIEEEYLDSRHPSRIRFIDDIALDSKRRDFTVNAIYMASDRSLIDPQSGVDDIEGRTLRMIGDPASRLKEDPLRILRAIRFKAQHGFAYDDKLYRDMLDSFALLKRLNPQKVAMEMQKYDMRGMKELVLIRKEACHDDN